MRPPPIDAYVRRGRAKSRRLLTECEPVQCGTVGDGAARKSAAVVKTWTAADSCINLRSIVTSLGSDTTPSQASVYAACVFGNCPLSLSRKMCKKVRRATDSFSSSVYGGVGSDSYTWLRMRTLTCDWVWSF